MDQPQHEREICLANKSLVSRVLGIHWVFIISMLEQQTNYNDLEAFVNLKIFRLNARFKPDLEPVQP
jgi:hypothetical protein